jgi:hypothetical protein
MTLSANTTRVKIPAVTPTARWRRETWSALSQEGRRRAWGIMGTEQRAALRAALQEADEDDA